MSASAELELSIRLLPNADEGCEKPPKKDTGAEDAAGVDAEVCARMNSLKARCELVCRIQLEVAFGPPPGVDIADDVLLVGVEKPDLAGRGSVRSILRTRAVKSSRNANAVVG